jgi:hypothetical protein
MKIILNQKLLIIALVTLVILLAGYIGADVYSGYMIGTMNSAYTVGYQDGMTAAIQQIMTEASSCEPVPIYLGNNSMNLIPVECLQQ